ncbi:MAG: glycosyltransferase [Deltaproteobacteria bacterium]|nr:glycosyltransferase [Deltaproteobacteria bacterium]
MDHSSWLVPAGGLVLFAMRLLPWRQLFRAKVTPPEPSVWPRVTVIVPARNEEAHLPRLLSSLAVLDYPDYEVIVIDDRSTDGTAAIAATFDRVKVVAGVDRPEHRRWGGKQWACHQGAAVATGDILLFTDADTEHYPDSVRRAVAQLLSSGAGLLSALPYHANPSLWEQLLGPFQLLIIALTAPFAPPRPRRLFVIGQYLMFRREAYLAIGGHEAVAGDFAEDLPLANLMVASGHLIHVYRGPNLFSVRMYASITEFVRGWRRNFRSGFIYASPLAGLWATWMIIGITGGMRADLGGLVVMGLGGLFIAWRQRALGRFRLIGAWLWPLSIGLFTWATLLAISDLVLRRDMVWKGRAYGAGGR